MWSVGALPRAGALLLWRRLPGAAGRLSATVRVALRDGDYLLAWPVPAVLAPPLAAAVGLLCGAAHPGPVFASSLLVVLVLAAVAGFGAAPGCYALLGYAIGDLALHRRSGASTVDILLRTDGAALVTYLVLAGLLVAAPLVATAARQRAQRLLRPGPARLGVGFTLAAALQAGLAWCWSPAAAILIRPVWSFWGAGPDPGPVGTLRGDGGWVAVATVLAVGARAALTVLAGRVPAAAPANHAVVRFRSPATLPWPVPVALSAAAATLLLAGLLGSALGAALLFALFVGLGVLRYRVVPALPGYARAVERVPLVLRVAGCGLLGYLMGVLAIGPAAARGVTSFLPAALALVPPLLLAALLLPARPPAAKPVTAPVPPPTEAAQ